MEICVASRYLPSLMPAVSVEQIEHAIENPADRQVGLLLDFEWLVPRVDGEWWFNRTDPQFPTYYCFTTPERMEPLRQENQRGKEFEEKPSPLTTPDGWNVVRPMKYQSSIERCELAPIRGRELFARLAATNDYHEVMINSGCGTYDEPNRGGALRLVSGNTRLLAQSLDPRPGTRILPARSIAEIHRYMRSFHLAGELTHRLEYPGDELAAVYEGSDVRGNLRRQAFTPVTPQSNPRDYGAGASQILCGGLMAHLLYSHRSTLRENFHPGTREGLHEETPELLRQIDELLKMLDPRTDRIVPEFFRYEHAPGFVRIHPEVIDGAWLRETRAEFERFLAGGPTFRL